MANLPNPSVAENESASQLTARADRRRVLKVGVISYEDRSISHGCIVRDVSESGAKLKFEHPVLLPKTFWLFVEFDAFRIECEIAWIRGLDMGVKFIGDKIAIPQTKKQEFASDWVSPEDFRDENPVHARSNIPNQSVHTGRVFGKRS